MLAVLCVLLVLTLSLWNLAVTNWQHAHNPVLGNFYSIDGRLMHLYCSGAGSPTVVIEAGASANSSEQGASDPALTDLETRSFSSERR